MYILFMAVALVVGAGLIIDGLRRHRRASTAAGALVLIGTAVLFLLMSFWGEMLWFFQAGYSSRFWRAVIAKAGSFLAGAVVTGLLLLFITRPLGRLDRWTTSSPLEQEPLAAGTPGIGPVRRWMTIFGAALGGAWGLASWNVVLLFLYRVQTDTVEPIIGKDTGFYLFTLPLLDRAYWLLFFAAFLAATATAIVAAAPVLVARENTNEGGVAEALARPLFVVLGFFALVLSAGKVLDVYHLLYSRWGVVYGPGWTDVHIRLPAYWAVATLLALAGAFLLLLSAVPRLSTQFGGSLRRLRVTLFFPVASIFTVWAIGLFLLPVLFQWLYVTPNEITVEKPYIANSIAFTRQGFDLDKVEETKFMPEGDLTEEVLQQNQNILSEVRLWDPRALEAVYQQFQEIRLYYKMADIDIDRYTFGNRYRQVMVAARELDQANLPVASQTFVNRHFKYTHGYGVTMASVRDFTPDGLPNLLIKDIPPVSKHPELAITRPEIYYGMRTNDYVVGNTEESELDYPSGDLNVYAHYAGKGGVELSSFWRRLVYGWTLGGTQLLFSEYPTNESRILFHRNVRERVQVLAPFLDFDKDAYIVLANGKLYWIIDGYTTSAYYPYSDPYFGDERIETTAAGGQSKITAFVSPYLRGINYARNSVKAVVDAYDGHVTFYVFAPKDPIIQVWSRAFPDLFRPKEEMPKELYTHVRYPEGFLLAQGFVYEKYHMTDPVVFYNQEDLWVRATERYYDQIRPVDPYYVMWQLPGQAGAELTLIQPFTPKNRQVLIGWIAGLCDPENYGRLIAYQLPKDQWILGTQQVDTKIDQDRYLSAQLSLWDQRGSRVIRGNVLVIPIGKTLLYVEPIYLQAEAAAYPELRIVVVMHGDKMSFADTFDEALRGLVQGTPPEGRLDQSPGRPADFPPLVPPPPDKETAPLR